MDILLIDNWRFFTPKKRDRWYTPKTETIPHTMPLHLLKTCTSVTSATVPTTGNACLNQVAATPLKRKLLMPMIHGPDLPVSIWTIMKRKTVSSTLRKERLCKSHGTQPGSQKNYKTRVEAFSRASISLKSISPHQTYLGLHQMNTEMIFKNKGSLPSKRATSTNPTMLIFRTK